MICRYEECKKALQAVHEDVDLSVLRGAQVVGMTTSGVADKQTLINALAPKVQALDSSRPRTPSPTYCAGYSWAHDFN